METHDNPQIGDGAVEAPSEAELELVIPFTEPPLTRAVLDRVATLTGGLNARVSLIAVHTVPYATTFGCPSSTHAFLVEQLVELSSACPLPVSAQVVLARTREAGLEFALKPGSTVAIGACRRWWRTAEERLARTLAAAGHKVVLVYVE
jgi:hypothetical protein